MLIHLIVFSLLSFARGHFAVSVESAAVSSEAGEVFLNISGQFPNPCYKLQHSIEKGEKVHKIHVGSYVEKGMCPMVLHNFKKKIPLGKMEAGEHQFEIVNTIGKKVSQKLIITR